MSDQRDTIACACPMENDVTDNEDSFSRRDNSGSLKLEDHASESPVDRTSARTEHTPGPWEIGHLGEFGSFEIGKGYDDERGDGWLTFDGFVICGRAQVIHRADEMRANARLIAAAPELLDALKAIVDIANEQMDGAGIRYTFDFNSPLGKKARTAIMKAEGR